MSQQQKDLARFNHIVDEFNRQTEEGPCSRIKWKSYDDACDALQDEIGEERMEVARDMYIESQR